MCVQNVIIFYQELGAGEKYVLIVGKMKQIDNFIIKIDYLGGPAWSIKIKPTGENYSLSTNVQVMGQLNEEVAYNHFKEKHREYFIDISGELVKD